MPKSLPAWWRIRSLILVGLVLAMGASHACGQGWTVLEATDAHLLIEVAVQEPRWQALTPEHGMFSIPGLDDSDLLQAREVPVLRLPVGLPPGGAVTVRAEIAPPRALERRVTELQPLDPRYVPHGDSRRKEADPLGFVQYTPPGWAASQRLTTLTIFPVRADARGHLLFAERLLIEITFSAGDVRTSGAGATFGNLLDRIVINPAQAAHWRGPHGVRRTLTPGDGFATATSPWIRIEIDRPGIYVLVADDLADIGIEYEDVDLTQLRLFCGSAEALPESTGVADLEAWMSPCALLLEDDGDGIWDAETRVYFMGHGPDGWGRHLGIAETEDDRYFKHPYANHFTYWLCWGGDFTESELTWIQREETTLTTSRPAYSTGRRRTHVEANSIYDDRPRDPGVPWERFYYTQIMASTVGSGATITMRLPGLVAGDAPNIRTALWGRTWVANFSPDHSALISVNDETLATAEWDNLDREIVSVSKVLTAETNRVKIEVPRRDNGQGGFVNDQIYLDWLEADYDGVLSAENDSLAFFVAAEVADSGRFHITDLEHADGWLLFEISDPRNPLLIEPQISAEGAAYAADFQFEPTGAVAEFVLLRGANAGRPRRVSVPDWNVPGLREATEIGPVDYVIVAGRDLIAAANTLAAHRTATFHGASGDTVMPGRVLCVTVDQVFDEFSWGQRDPAAVRNLLVYIRDLWPTLGISSDLSHLVLFGDANYDPRNYNDAKSDVVPTHFYWHAADQYDPDWEPSFSEDDWFGILDGPDDVLLDVAVGRLPVSSTAEAEAVVAKIIKNETAPPVGEWRTRLLFAADDICQSYANDAIGWGHMRQTEALSDTSTAPADAQQHKLYLYEYGHECRYERKPETSRDLMDSLEKGALLFNFIGHGSEVQLADERLLELSNISSMANTDKPFLMITASCAVGKFAHGGDGISLAAMRLANRGALAVVSASCSALSGPNSRMNKRIIQELFPEQSILYPVAIGPAVMGGKLSSESGDRLNNRRYTLLGDPASRFATPANEIELVVAQPAGAMSSPDTLLRATVTQLTGTIRDLSGLPRSDFNGQVTLSVYDSDLIRTSLEVGSIDYWLPGARIYSNEVEVTAGTFVDEFFVPTALRSGLRGVARIFAYAIEDDGGGDAAGARTDLHIDERSAAIDDTLGPTITLAWGDPGAAIEEGSLLEAHLEDESGIYVTMLSPSRSVVLTVEDAHGRVLHAADLAGAVTFGSDFREATLSYALAGELPAGEPLKLVLEASDNVGQRGSATLDFVFSGVSTTDGRLLSRAYNLPNPVDPAAVGSEKTRFLVELARTADLEIALYTVSGRKIRTLEGHSLSPNEAATEGLPWDGRDEDGDWVANGLYFYRVIARDGGGVRAELIERLIVAR